MKFYKILAALFALLMLFSISTFAQDEEMTMEQWEQEMAALQTKKAQLTTELTACNNDVNSLKAQYQGMKTYDEAMNDLYALVGTDKDGVDAFRNQVNALESKINRKEGPKADRQAELDALKRNKISALPEFFDKVHNQLQKKLDAWTEEAPKTNTYTVVKGDCLWNIAKKRDIYDNAFAWPVIYKANRDQIKNPDLIYPKQVFKIPELTTDEKAKYEKMRKNYKPAPPPQN
ncbi:MAG: LysM peptidoglycan-binding domain-containing protein [Ignavibacteriales bacterium]|nr:LysM peptidoglycan-binding domain-containing protein [Ignavibacteriales bacterium]